MPQVDLPLEELERYRPDVAEPADFDAFWAGSLAEAAQHPLARGSSRSTRACRSSRCWT
jgi:cephalosporin-C deacetylase